jgi:L-ascorbate metabolism protein UlaG (beta-lactamase superfamily)
MHKKFLNSHKFSRLIFGFSLFQFLGCASVSELSKVKISDHFDGEKFYNPTLNEQISVSFSGALKLLKEERDEWPEHVENLGTPRLNEKLGAGDIALTFVNHATFLIQLPGINILTDPVWSDRPSPVSWIGPKRIRVPGIRFEDLPNIDVIVISHNHYDHLDTETLERLNERFSPKVLIPVGNKDLIESIGIKNVRDLDWWESVQINHDIQITFTPTQHTSGRGLFDREESLWGSYFIQNGEVSVYFGGDAAYSTHYKEINKRLGPPDIALLSIGAYLPRWFMKPIHLDPVEAVIASQDLGAKLSIGMHFETFQLSTEAFDQPQKDLKVALEREGLPQDFLLLFL